MTKRHRPLSAKSSSHLLKHSLIYGLGEMLNKAFGFVLIPVYTRHLTTDDYGILQLLLLSSNIFVVMLQMGLGSAIFKFILYNEKVNLSTAYSTAFSLIVVCSTLLTLPVLFIPRILSELLTGSPEHALIIQILALSMIFRNFAIIPLAKLRIEEKSTHYSILSSSKFLLQLIMTLVFVIHLQKGIQGIIMAEMITSLLFCIVFMMVIFPSLRLTFSLSYVKDMLRFGLPLVPAALAMFILNMSDRYFLRYYGTLEDVGLYSLGYRFAMIMSLIVSAFQQAWGAGMFKIANEPIAKEIFAKGFTHFVLLLSFVGLAVSIFAKDILSVMATERFLAGYKIVPFVLFAYLFFGIYYYTSAGLNITKKTKYQPIVVGMAAALNIGLNYALIPHYGMVGAAAATLISFIFMAATITNIAQRFYYVHFEVTRVIKVFLAVSFILAVNYFWIIEIWLLAVTFRTALLFSFPILLWAMRFFNPAEIAKFRSLLSRSQMVA